MKQAFKSLVAVLVIGALTLAAMHFTTSMQQERQRGRRGAGADGPVPVVAAQARIDDVPVWLEGVGTAKARNTVTVRAQVEGKILSIDFKEGQDVKKGDVLAHIDPVTYQAQYDQAVAKKALDEALLANSKRDLERYAKVGTLAVSQQQIDTQRALVAQQEAQVKSDQAAIDNVHAILGYTTVVAPIDGRTGIRQIDVGNIVRTSDTPIVTLTEVRPISVIFTLPQQQLPDINKARADKPLRVDALETGHKTVLDTGELQVVDNQVDQTTGTIRLKADFPNKDLQLWPGQFVNVRLLLRTLEQVVVIPTSAVQRGPDGTFVYVIGEGSKASMRPVTVAQQDDADAVISQGLSASEQVVTAGFARLKDGAEVKVSEPAAKTPAVTALPGEPQADATGLAPGSDTASIAPAAEQQQPTPAATGETKHKRGEGKHRGQRKDASAAPGSAPGSTP